MASAMGHIEIDNGTSTTASENSNTKHEHHTQTSIVTSVSVSTPSILCSNSIHLTRISSSAQLSLLPPEFLSSSTSRPLLHVDENENEYEYFLDPMKKAVGFILMVEMLERFSFYGINYTTEAYLTGAYNENWNADMPSILASSYVSISTAVAYSSPFLGAILADYIFGEYVTILVGSMLCYIPGLTLIALSTIPDLLGRVFNISAVKWGLLVLWPIGTGTVKACVNVFGAKQFHPILQSSLIESYYVNFYMCINIGALTGGIIVPILAQWNVSVAYFVPVGILGIGVTLFAAATVRYVQPKPKYDLCRILTIIQKSIVQSKAKNKKHLPISVQPTPSESRVGIGTVALVSGLVIPFNVAYAQMATTFILQGTVMKPYGLIDAPMMNNADAISVLAFGYLIGNILYPALNKRQIKLSTTYKFAIGSAFGAAAVGCAIIIDYAIHWEYKRSGEAISVLWQTFPYFFIGIGEIFAVSAAYEVAFTVAPAKKKTLASAANLFMVGGAPNVFCILLYNACQSWFLNARGTTNIHRLKDYASTRIVNYFWLLEIVSIFGVIINVLPPVKKWVASIEEAAADSVKSPLSTPSIQKKLLLRRKLRSNEFNRSSSSINSVNMESMDNENTPLVIAKKKHARYLKQHKDVTFPQLMKSGSMRAGPSLKSRPFQPFTKNKENEEHSLVKISPQIENTLGTEISK